MARSWKGGSYAVKRQPLPVLRGFLEVRLQALFEPRAGHPGRGGYLADILACGFMARAGQGAGRAQTLSLKPVARRLWPLWARPMKSAEWAAGKLAFTHGITRANQVEREAPTPAEVG